MGTATSFTVTGLTNGTRSFFRVFAHNAAGTSTSSNVANAVPRAVPSAPRSLTVALVSVRAAAAVLVAPLSNNGAAVTDYTIQRSPNGTSGWVTINDGVGTATVFTVIGLTNGTRYYFRVFARNAAGLGPASNVTSSVPRSDPHGTALAHRGADQSLRPAPAVVAGARLQWRPRRDRLRDPAFAERNVRLGDAQRRVRTTTTYTVTGLANGTRYYFRVFARNAAGQSLGSNVATAIPRTVPSAPLCVAGRADRRVGRVGGVVAAARIHRRFHGHLLCLPDLAQRTLGWVTLPGDVITSPPAFLSGAVDGIRYYLRVFARNALAQVRRATSPADPSKRASDRQCDPCATESR